MKADKIQKTVSPSQSKQSKQYLKKANPEGVAPTLNIDLAVVLSQRLSHYGLTSFTKLSLFKIVRDFFSWTALAIKNTQIPTTTASTGPTISEPSNQSTNHTEICLKTPSLEISVSQRPYFI